MTKSYWSYRHYKIKPQSVMEIYESQYWKKEIPEKNTTWQETMKQKAESESWNMSLSISHSKVLKFHKSRSSSEAKSKFLFHGLSRNRVVRNWHCNRQVKIVIVYTYHRLSGWVQWRSICSFWLPKPSLASHQSSWKSFNVIPRYICTKWPFWVELFCFLIKETWL